MTVAPRSQLPFRLGQPATFGGLSLVPLMSRRQPVLEYIGLDEAAALGLSITEVNADGSVNSLLVRNPLNVPVVLFEGEELVGAKQNRVLDRTALVPSGSEAHVTVNCVERGRWAYRGER